MPLASSPPLRRSEVPSRRGQVRVRARGPRRGGEAAVPGEGQEEHQGPPGGAGVLVHEQGGLLHTRPGKGMSEIQYISATVPVLGSCVMATDCHTS